MENTYQAKKAAAKAYLSQAFLLDQCINSNIAELSKLRLMSQSISSQGCDEHYNATVNTQAPFVKQIEKIMLLEETINNEIDRLVDLKTQIRQTIDALPDINERMVLRYRYIEQMSFEQIGFEMCAVTRTVRRWHANALSHIVLPNNSIDCALNS
ncbi:MAG: DUF1492 domain-containing protein [Clostridiales bacterium]|nr:DUF1492 domain-containing protein [Clostridiales bacterium]